MKNMKYSLFTKVICIFLSTIIFIITGIMTVAFIGIASFGGLWGSDENLKQSIAESYLNSQSYQVFYYYTDNNGSGMEDYLSNKNYYCTLYDEKENILFNNYNGELVFAEYYDEYEHTEYFAVENPHEDVPQKTTVYYMKLYAKTQFSEKDMYTFVMGIVDYVFANRITFLIFSIINIVLIIALVIFLCTIVGKKDATSEPKRNFIDRIPYDIFITLYVLFGILEFLLIEESLYSSTLITIICVSAVIIADFPLILMFILSTATRIKTNTLFKNNVLYFVIRFVCKILRNAFLWLKHIISNLAFVPKTIIALSLLVVLNCFIFSAGVYVYEEFLVIFFLIELLVITLFIIYYVICLRNLQKAGEKIAKGDFEHRVDLKFLRGNLLSFGKHLNNIGKGMESAVSNEIKSERLKTELITNVSHDIKTPLTSIINYVDLIKKEQPENEKINEYIAVLDKQSSRLKKLIEDLIEASKASTGNIAVNYEPCELGVLLTQTAGEYEERAAKNGLEILIEKDENPVIIMADGRHLWRIFDNLMNNICKYSQSGTRVYLSLKKYGNKAVVTFRNISKTSLNISSDELMDRFVRGDSSRNTEGSGLGLSIARSLVELQNGKMILNIDGDLFKVLITFDII